MRTSAPARSWGLLLSGLSLGLLTTGCPKEKPAETTGPTPNAGAPQSADRKLKIAVIPKGTANSFWLTVKAGADAAGKEENVEIVWQGPDKENSITEQINILQTQVTNKVDGIVLAATDKDALVKPVQDAVDKSIPVVTIDSGLEKGKDPSLALIATDNVEGGRRAAEALAREIGNAGNVGLLIFLKGAASSDDRQKGFEEGIAKFPGIKIVQTLETQSDVSKAVTQTETMLTAHPDIKGIFAANEPNGVGAANVLKQRSLAGKVKLVAYDSSKEEVKAIEDGIIQATVVQDPFQMGYKGVKTVLQAIRKQPVTEKFVNSGMTVVTKANMNTPDVQKLLNPKLTP